MGYSRRKEAHEIAEAVRASNQAIEGLALGTVCAAGVVTLPVACHNCPRRGRYRVTRLIDRHGPGMKLLTLKDLLAGNCPKRMGGNALNPCGAYFPDLAVRGTKGP